MGGRTMAPSFSSLTTQKQKEYIASMVAQNIVRPMELKAIGMEMQFLAALEGRKYKPMDETELALLAAQREKNEMEKRQIWLAALAATLLYREYAESEDEVDGQQRLDAFG